MARKHLGTVKQAKLFYESNSLQKTTPKSKLSIHQKINAKSWAPDWAISETIKEGYCEGGYGRRYLFPNIYPNLDFRVNYLWHRLINIIYPRD